MKTKLGNDLLAGTEQFFGVCHRAESTGKRPDWLGGDLARRIQRERTGAHPPGVTPGPGHQSISFWVLSLAGSWIIRSQECEKPRGSFDESPPSRGPHIRQSRTRGLYFGRTRHCSEDLCRRPRHRGLPPARRLLGCLSLGSTTRRSPARLDPFGSSRRDCGSSLASRSARSIGSFPPFVRCFEVSLQARVQCKPWKRG